MAVQVNLRLERELLAAVDRARGDVARSVWFRRAVEQALDSAGRNPEPSSVAPRAAAPAPAEQPERSWHEEVLQDGRPVAERPLSALDAEQLRRDAFARAGRRR